MHLQRTDQYLRVALWMSAALQAPDKAVHKMPVCLIEEDVLSATRETTPNRETMASIRTVLSKYS